MAVKGKEFEWTPLYAVVAANVEHFPAYAFLFAVLNPFVPASYDTKSMWKMHSMASTRLKRRGIWLSPTVRTLAVQKMPQVHRSIIEIIP